MASPMVVTKPEDVREACDAARARGQRVGFVPTMGSLHAGHLALVADAGRRADFTVCSIFVNPTQFGPDEDFQRYPRDLARDVGVLGDADLVFAPEPPALYLRGDETRVRVGALASSLCGPFRPSHFEGVATVVTKLFGIVGPCVAIFGRKDYQQWLVVRRVVRDLFLPVEIVAHPIVREPDGLAMSSRNAYLAPAQRLAARALPHALAAAARAFARGERDVATLRREVLARLEPVTSRIDYVALADPETLAPVAEVAPDRIVLAVACHLERTRLIDNTVLGEDALLEVGDRD